MNSFRMNSYPPPESVRIATALHCQPVRLSSAWVGLWADTRSCRPPRLSGAVRSDGDRSARRLGQRLPQRPHLRAAGALRQRLDAGGASAQHGGADRQGQEQGVGRDMEPLVRPFSFTTAPDPRTFVHVTPRALSTGTSLILPSPRRRITSASYWTLPGRSTRRAARSRSRGITAWHSTPRSRPISSASTAVSTGLPFQLCLASTIRLSTVCAHLTLALRAAC